MDKFEQQMELESEMVGLGKQRYWKNVQAAKERGDEASTPYGAHLMKVLLPPLAESIKAFVAEAYSGKPSAKAVAAKYLKDMEPETVAFLTLKEALNGATIKRPALYAALAVATAIEDEQRFCHFANEDSEEWKYVSKRVEKQTDSLAHRRRVLMVMMSRAAQENAAVAWESWQETEKVHIGSKCLDLLIESTGAFEYVTFKSGKNRTETKITATAVLLDAIQRRSDFCELLQPVYLPTIIPPKPWTNPYSGGYHSTAVRRLPLVKTKNRNYLEELANTVRDMPMVYRSINLVQSTAWRVNTPVLEVMQQVWDSGLQVKGIPQREDYQPPQKPADIATNKQARKEWKRAASEIYTKNNQLASKRILAAKLIYLAEKFQKEESIYFPMQLDFRGRMYAVPSYLTPQGCDAAKGLLTFAEGKPVNEQAMRWLKIHGANCYGEDKCSMDDRVKWVEEHHEEIMVAGRDPLEHSSVWIEADKPWQFLAFCIEYSRVVSDPSYRSCLPVSVDGACNGLQHFSAMLRDPIGGAAVNLVPSTVPQDIYARVADVAKKKVERDAQDGDTFATEWLTHGINRKVAKRPVMVLPYGGTLYSSRDFVADYMREVGFEWSVPFDHFKAASYLAGHIWSSIGDVVVAARAAMTWLQQCADAACKEEIPITWTTPVGFPVQQAYPNLKSRRIKTKIAGSMIRMSLAEATDSLDTKRQRNGISPNFVHSMDACCLMLSTCRSSDEGITQFAMVHDSYGTTAADMERMAVCLREAFVDLYQEDVLADFRKGVCEGLSDANKKKVPPVPEKGDLNIEAVKDSVYFFA